MKNNSQIWGLLATFLALVSVAQAEDWPQFRGDNASGVSASIKSLPTDFSQTENLVWSMRLGEGIGSPIVVHGKVFCTSMIGERTDLVVAGSGKLKGYDPVTGREIWHASTLMRTVMTSPVVRDGLIFSSVQSYGDDSRTLKFALLEWLDTNQDGSLAREEVPKEFWDRFDQSDKDKNKVIAGTELDTAFQSADNMIGGGTTIQAVRGGGVGDVTSTHVVWNLHNRSPSNLTSPLVVGDQLFVVKKGGISSSFDIATGAAHWELVRIKNIGDYYGSPVAGDGKIFVPGENGFIVVLEQGPRLNILAKNDIGESCLSCPAISDGRLFIRGRETLFCFSEENKR